MDSTKRKLSILFVIGILLLGAMIGSLLGELLRSLIPDGVVKEVFLRSIDIMLGPAVIDLIMFSITLGFTLKLNFIGIIGLAVAYYILRFWR
ncbi:MAG: DUF4321 domain-containing protein [Candidatus Marinimicrobia bacterium]|jgi:putative exporter of polyketide antibiotics|nr:DUF4321 domain-containing protein [Candidatus Neomarinimicrobiota bacterium]MBP9004949.1 DUF4321 domain-containing protein [Candidatus Neomarinimicrobiota bacterium]NLA21743.1 DUF4321 domain-containing protein [Candidatus Neomarinimicrobiota bacterium]HNZ37414.1 DUF4321 domain-containing protein [Candidatus Neomarinimicrobiota bacterium]HOD37319.1 DUF4321 domain-containing protein [Candidatus Neomarinimicrobiota bacterium]